MFGDLSQQTLALLNKTDFNKTTITQTQIGGQTANLNAFDLRGPALLLYPVLTPLRNKLARVLSDRGDTATRWKAISGVNTTNLDMGVQNGKRSGEMAITEQDYLAAYAGIGLEASIDWEAVWSGGKEFDNKATLTQSLLRAVMIGEEALLLNGNASVGFGIPATPTATLVAGGGITAQAGNIVFVVALTARGLLNASIAGGVPLSVVRTNIDGTSTTYNGGTSNKSLPSAAVTTVGGTQSIACTVAAVPGAAGYAWFLGTAAANAVLSAITTVNAVTLTANGAGTQVASAVTADFSANATVFDGFVTQAAKSGSGAYYKSLDNGTLNADGANGVTEIDAALQFFWDIRRLSPDEMWVNSQEALNINKKIVANGGQPLFRFTTAVGSEPQLMGGASIAKYWNKFTQQFVDLIIHPNQTPGTILFKTNQIPYPLSGVGDVQFVQCRRDYYQIEWPIVSRQYVYGVYADQVLVHRAPFSLGLIQNIKNG